MLGCCSEYLWNCSCYCLGSRKIWQKCTRNSEAEGESCKQWHSLLKLHFKLAEWRDYIKIEASDWLIIFLNKSTEWSKGAKCKMKTRHGKLCQETNVHDSNAEWTLWKCTRLAVCWHLKISLVFIQAIFFCINLLIVPGMLRITELKLFASCVNLGLNSSLTVGKIGLNAPVIKTKISWIGNTTLNIGHQASKEWYVVFKI